MRPTPSLIEAEAKHREALGLSALSSILLAAERGVPLYTDDLTLRQVAKVQWQVTG